MADSLVPSTAVEDYLVEFQEKEGKYYTKLPRNLASGNRILGASPETRELAAIQLLNQSPKGLDGDGRAAMSWAIERLLEELLKLQTMSSPSFVSAALLFLSRWPMGFQRGGLAATLVRTIEAASERAPFRPEELSQVLGVAQFIERCWDGHPMADEGRAIKTLKRIAGALPPSSELEPGEAWSDAVIRQIHEFPAPAGDSWKALLRHASTASGSAPSGRWLKSAASLVTVIPAFVETLDRWFGEVRKGASVEIGEDNADILKGLAWAATTSGTSGLAAAVADLCETCLRKIPNVGARSAKVANACLWALSAMPGRDAIAQLGRLQLKAKYATAKKLIGRALDAAAKREGMTRQDLEEIVVPSFGLGADGTLRQKLGEFTAEIRITGTTEAELRFVAADGKVPKSVPAAVKKDHAEELKALRRTQKDIEAMLPAQRERLERLLFGGRSWAPTDWRERFLDPPLLSGMARRLIWTADGVPAFPRDGGFVDAEDRPLPMPARLELWHPITSSADTVLAWRRFLQKHEITQPFKQAHREIYAITPAEIATGTYSNRFAAHILRQHQFAALCQQRGWSYRLFGGFDSGGTPTLALPDHDLVAEFWVEGLGETLSQNGICVYISTDQVRFYSSAREQLRIETVPPRLFSEVMRNVDLFVGVCSIGGDPTWLDRGERREYDTYWRETSFGELTATAQSRSEVLSGLLPRLKIRDRCRIEGRFLVVKGDLRTYKIHLGSANILMEPNDQYLCIVPDRSPKGVGDKVFLPFEGDSTLSVILSKAFLLSDDAKIRDETILRQLKK